MVIKERIAKSQIHFYIQQYLDKGYQKVADKKTPYMYSVRLERNTGGKVERITFMYTRNGWLTIY